MSLFEGMAGLLAAMLQPNRKRVHSSIRHAAQQGTIRHNNRKSRLRAERRSGRISARQQRKREKLARRAAKAGAV